MVVVTSGPQPRTVYDNARYAALTAGMYITYTTRPLWDTFKGPYLPNGSPLEGSGSIVLPHFHQEGVHAKDLCALHGWQQFNQSKNTRKIVDAVVFASELDLLEIRLIELWDVIDLFVILESPVTFTGLQKPLVLEENRARFEWAFSSGKIKYIVAQSLAPLTEGESPFNNERRMRAEMSSILDRILRPGDVYFSSDIDEIPYHYTVDLFRSCTGYPTHIQLQMQSFRYSLEFPIPYDVDSKPSARVYLKSGASLSGVVADGTIIPAGQGRVGGSTYCRHACLSLYALADSGWHCSWCFRTLAEFQFKMDSYSHADRVRHPSFLNPARIQDIICHGGEIFDMLPEAYTFWELFAQRGNLLRSQSATHIPLGVSQNPQTYKFMLPGGCLRP
ncbi:glycosyltransferase family 17 protein [Pelomyxa schiedti]|nr:glycosyltransferase family 17 protein [Pelomyxa schiedti]